MECLVKACICEMRQRVLLIKLTSLGDLIHALPALTDAKRACPEITFDWVIDEQFQEIAKWHPAIHRVWTTNHRNWRHTLMHPGTIRAIRELVRLLRKEKYDLVIDGQGNFKTALLSTSIGGMNAGFDRHSVREWVAHLAYKKRYSASKEAHAIERLRRLFASALHYPLPLSSPDFQIQRDAFVKPSYALPEKYLVFVHNASWVTKLWPMRHWSALISHAAQLGYPILLPWGNAAEKTRAELLARESFVHVLPQVSLSEMGYVLAGARACICMDTGLSHLVAALHVPAVTLYGATDSGLVGASGKEQIHVTSRVACAPCHKKTCSYGKGENPCLAEISPERVFDELVHLLTHM